MRPEYARTIFPSNLPATQKNIISAASIAGGQEFSLAAFRTLWAATLFANFDFFFFFFFFLSLLGVGCALWWLVSPPLQERQNT
ncbi:hypothetical protein EV426DRAFT_132204 [Tirmania nivea]|nr:hypothetical protein EV426DRAFT_132204 [Tirmania nivea]